MAVRFGRDRAHVLGQPGKLRRNCRGIKRFWESPLERARHGLAQNRAHVPGATASPAAREFFRFYGWRSPFYGWRSTTADGFESSNSECLLNLRSNGILLI